ncbi:MAG: T9SS type A sorting domain-containing protein [Bacteroidales bacterium]|nr:T9SS type A sorting domain-containing protein [Bacteroidales bacterium]
MVAIIAGFVSGGVAMAQTPNLTFPFSHQNGYFNSQRCVNNGWDTVVDCNNPSIYLKIGTSVTSQQFSHYTTERPVYRPVIPFEPSSLLNMTEYGYQYMPFLSTDDVEPDSTLTATGYNRFTSSIALPFNFCFFGHVYDAFCIGEDGVISFGRYQENATVNPNVAPINSILAVFEDLNPYHGTQINRDPNRGIYYNVVGEFPHRKICVTWYKVPQAGYTDAAQHYATFQVVLYEGTNIIDIFVEHHSVNNLNRDWFTSLTNRNGNYSQQVNGGWVNAVSISQKAWRFVPQGERELGLTWYEGTDTSVRTGRVIARDVDSILVNPTATTTYTACLRYHSCNGLDYIFSQPIVVGYDNSSNVSIQGPEAVANGESARLMLDLSNNYGLESINWFDGSNAQSVHVNPTATTTYWCVVKGTNGCVDRLTHTVALGNESKGVSNFSDATITNHENIITVRCAANAPVIVTDVTGRVVYQTTGKHAETLDIQVPGHGVYLVKLAGQKVTKVAVMR